MELLTEEEDYYPGEQHNTKLMVTRLRKIYYNSWGWSTEVIRKAAKVPGRYHTEMVHEHNPSKKITYRKYTHKKHQIIPLTYKLTYTKNDRIYPERAGETPEIYVHDNQELVSPQGYYCDIGHILSGIDAFNNFEPISPLPDFLFFLRFLFPTVDSNMDFATWLGDIASSAGDFYIEKLRKRIISNSIEQQIIDKDAPGSDMIGNIDSYVIKKIVDTKSENGLRVTEIFHAYFYEPDMVKNYQSKAISIFCDSVGLKKWNGLSFDNEKEWLKYYKGQLRNATSFYVYGEIGKLKGIWHALKIWLHLCEKTINLDLLLRIFLDALKKQIIHELNSKK
jgi:hypothetical protein